MSLLTDDEKSLLVLEHLGPKALAHNTMSLLEAFELGLKVAETEVIKKLAAGVDVEPVAYGAMNKQGDLTSTLKRRDGWRTIPLYTTEAIAAARVKTLNEAAVLAATPVGTLSKSIRALIGANQ